MGVQLKRYNGTGWVNLSPISSYNDLTDKPTTFTPATHDNNAHSKTYMDANAPAVTNNLSMGEYDLVFSGSDQGDIIWKNASGVEQHRIWNPPWTDTLAYRGNDLVSRKLLHTGNITTETFSKLNVGVTDGIIMGDSKINQLDGYLQLITGGNEITFDSGTTTMYVNYRAPASGAKIDTWIWNAGTNAVQAVHRMKELQFGDTNTRIYEGSGNAVRITTNSGYIDVGAQNTSYAHMHTDRAKIHMNKPLELIGKGVVTATDGTQFQIWKGTQASYDALGSYSATTIYLITN